jgi:hypothetical protein
MITTDALKDQQRSSESITMPYRPWRRISGSIRYGIILLAAGVLASLSGCGQKAKEIPVGTVSGTVTVKGKPLEIGRLNFASGQQGTGASGSLGPEGKYTLDGPLATGTYDVFVSFEISPAQFGTPAAEVLKTVPSKYQKQNTSKLVAQVEEGANELTFELK